MKKLSILLVILFSLVLVSCASNNVKNEWSGEFYTDTLEKSNITIVDNSELRELFFEFNEEFFDNKLMVDYIGYTSINNLKLKNGKGHNLGNAIWYKNPNGRLICGVVLVKDKSIYPNANTTFKGVLIHEMIHLYFYQRSQFNEKHGENFCKKVDEINKKSNNKYKVPYN